MRTTSTLLGGLAAVALAGAPLSAGAAVHTGDMSAQKIALGSGGGGPTGVQVVDQFHMVHIDGMKGAKRVAISVFNVAFPSDNTLTANMKAKGGVFNYSAKASMHTALTGVDQATQQRIADAAYAAFVADLKSAGFEVVGPEELAKLAPEINTWTSVPNFNQGRYGAYVAPAGYKVHFLRGDTAKRDTSGQLGQSAPAFRALDFPQAFSRSPYIAATANLGIIAVTLVVDYGVYTSTGESRKIKAGAEITFTPGVTAQAGSFYDTATMLDYWGTKSGGFPAMAALAAPLISDRPFAEVKDDAGGSDIGVKADPALFEKAAAEAAEAADAKLVAALAGAAAR